MRPSTTSAPAVTAKSTYATGKGLYGLDTSTSTSTHYGVFGSASGTGAVATGTWSITRTMPSTMSVT